MLQVTAGFNGPLSIHENNRTAALGTSQATLLTFLDGSEQYLILHLSLTIHAPELSFCRPWFLSNVKQPRNVKSGLSITKSRVMSRRMQQQHERYVDCKRQLVDVPN
jgi:hypothetical protein